MGRPEIFGAKITVTITFDPTNGGVSVNGPDFLEARTMYDYIFEEIKRMTVLQFVEAAANKRVIPVAGGLADGNNH